MAEDEDQRKKDEAIEAIGADWARRKDEFLIGYVSKIRHSEFHSPAIVEMQRRQVIAIREFNETATRQANTMIRLTAWIIALTVILGFIAGLQLWAMLVKGA